MANDGRQMLNLLDLVPVGHPQYDDWRRFVFGLSWTVLNEAGRLLNGIARNPNQLNFDGFANFIRSNGFFNHRLDSPVHNVVPNNSEEEPLEELEDDVEGMHSNAENVKSELSSEGDGGNRKVDLDAETKEIEANMRNLTIVPRDELRNDQYANSELDYEPPIKRPKLNDENPRIFFRNINMKLDNGIELAEQRSTNSTENPVRTIQPMMKWACSRCGIDFYVKHLRDCHLKGCRESTLCKLKALGKGCAAMFKSKNRLKKNGKKCSNEQGEFVCPYCGDRFPLQIKRIRHIQKHHPNSYLKCFGEAKSESSSEDSG